MVEPLQVQTMLETFTYGIKGLHYAKKCLILRVLYVY